MLGQGLGLGLGHQTGKGLPPTPLRGKPGLENDNERLGWMRRVRGVSSSASDPHLRHHLIPETSSQSLERRSRGDGGGGSSVGVAEEECGLG